MQSFTKIKPCEISIFTVANRQYPDQKKQSDLGLPFLSRLFWQATNACNFITFTICLIWLKIMAITTTVDSGVARTLKKLRTSKGDYCIKH